MSERTRVSLTLDKDIVNHVDHFIDGRKIRNRSHAVEVLLSKALKNKSVNKAFLLAGGKGTRLRPITYEMPKPMVPVKGKPLLEYHINFLKKYDITDIIISIGYLGDQIKEYFGDGSRFGVNITYVKEDDALGTAGPIRHAKHLLDDGPFVVINTDNLWHLDFNAMQEQHFKTDSIATLALVTVKDPTPYGVARLSGNKILEFVEKPSIEDAPSRLINAGVYILSSKIFDYIPDKKHSMIETEVFPKIIFDGKLYGFTMAGQWLPAGTPEEYERAIKEWEG